MRRVPPVLLLVGVTALLVAWVWFWTGPELQWEHQLFAASVAEAPP